MNNKFLFISYASDNYDFAIKLNSDLLSNNIKTWIDNRGIRSGDDWPNRIAEAVLGCTALLVILSPESVKSKWVLRELAFADLKEKPILPLYLSQCVMPAELELRIGNIQWTSFIKGNYTENFKDLFLSIAKLFDLELVSPIKLNNKPIYKTQPNVPFSKKSTNLIKNNHTDLVITPPAIEKPYNLNFVGPMIENQPAGWFNSLGFVDQVSTEYIAKIVSKPDNPEDKCLLFQHPKAKDYDFGSLMQRIPIINQTESLIRFEGELKLEDVGGWAGLWIRADGLKTPNLFFNNMSDKQIRGTIPWRTYSLEESLPKETAWLNYGIILVGRGKLWADNFRLKRWLNGDWIDFNDM